MHNCNYQTFGTLMAAELKKAEIHFGSKCPHGVHIPKPDIATGKAGYCLLCYPGGPPFKTRMVALPSSRNHELDAHAVGFANKRRSDCCPECGSPVHEEVSGSLWACAECSTKYKAPKRRTHA
jgi:hypothetical protein